MHDSETLDAMAFSDFWMALSVRRGQWAIAVLTDSSNVAVSFPAQATSNCDCTDPFQELAGSSLCFRFRDSASSAGVEEGVEFEMPVCVESFFGVDCTTKNHASALKLRTNACDDVQKATKQQKQGGGGCHFGCRHLSGLGFHHGKGAWKFAF